MDIPKLIERAREAAGKRNYDYALSLYQQILAVQPDNASARAELRTVLFKRSAVRKLSPLTARLLAVPQWIGIALARLGRKPDNMIRACERYLKVDPHNLHINLRLGQSLEEAGHLNSAIAVYEFVHSMDQRNTEALKRAGLLKYRTHDIQGALQFFERVLAIQPRDSDAEKMRKNLAAEDTLSSGSYATAGSSQELVKEKDEAAYLQRKERLYKTADEIDTEIVHLKKQIEADPQNKQVQKDLGALYARKKNYTAARAVYQELLQDDPESYDLKCRLGDLDIKSLSDAIDDLKGDTLSGSDEDRAQKVRTLKRERLKKQVKEYEWRVKFHPTDLGLWFTYGQLVFQAGLVDEAIQAFQQSVKDPRHKVLSMHFLGKLFFKKELYDLASKQLQGALKASGGVSNKSKAIVYDLGKVADAQGIAETALNWYLKIFEIDINYKDVASKIEALRSK